MREKQALIVGDVMRMSVALVDQLRARESDDTLLVRVSRIDQHPSGLVTLYLENATPDEEADNAN